MEQHVLNSAIEFLRRNLVNDGMDRVSIVNACIAFLKGQPDIDISDETARRIASKALGEVERRFHMSDIDIDASTSHTVFVRSNGASYAFTTSMLLNIMRSQAIPIT